MTLAAIATACSSSTSPSAPPTTGAAPSASRAAFHSPATSASAAPERGGLAWTGRERSSGAALWNLLRNDPFGVNAEPGKWKLTVSAVSESASRVPMTRASARALLRQSRQARSCWLPIQDVPAGRHADRGPLRMEPRGRRLEDRGRVQLVQRPHRHALPPASGRSSSFRETRL